MLRRAESPVIAGAAALVVLLACLLPLLGIGAELLAEGAVSKLGATLGQARSWELMARSAGLALAVTACALLVGVPMGVVLGRSDLGGRRAALWLHLFPVFLPPFLLALGWFHLLGRQGLVGTPWTADLLFGPAGVVLVWVLAFAPIVTVLTALGLSGVDPSLEEAARTVARPRRVVTHILLPLAWRPIALSALVVFALAFSEIGVPMFLRVRTYPAAVFARLGGIDFAPGEALALVLPLLALGIVLVVIDRRIGGRGSRAAFGLRSPQSTPLSLGAARPWASILVWLVVGASLLPLLAVVLRAGGSGLASAVSWVGPSLITSLLTASVAAAIIVLVGLVLGHGLARARGGAGALDVLTLLAFMTPASVLAVGLIDVWNRPETRLVYATSAILVVGLVARYAAVGIRTLAAVFDRVPPHFEEAAACAGAGYARRMSRILVPMRARAVLGAWLLAFLFCMRDLDTVIPFYPPGHEPLVVRIFTLEANGPPEVVAGLSVIHVAATAVVLMLAAVVSRGRRRLR